MPNRGNHYLNATIIVSLAATPCLTRGHHYLTYLPLATTS
jgi:hypothetical protein